MKQTNLLRQYFPLIRAREDVLAEIKDSKHLHSTFTNWRKEQQEEFLDFCTGARGVKILYDSFFKEIINPEYSPYRLDSFLSELLRQKIRVVKILPNDSVRIATENTLLITDIVVQLADGSLANIEIQKIGYMFPAERASCYSADLLLRQYKRIRDESKKRFSYKDIKPVYTIVLFEQSPSEFHQFPNDYLHYIDYSSNSGISLNLLQKYLFIPLDIFQKITHNITNKVDAWLSFLCKDDPESIVRLITTYPEFKPLYEDIYQLCLNTEKVMEMFSKELQILDENTVQYMIDEMQDTINDMNGTINEMQKDLDSKDATIELLRQQISDLTSKKS